MIKLIGGENISKDSEWQKQQKFYPTEQVWFKKVIWKTMQTFLLALAQP